jgi:hypothetical protein
LVIATSGQIDQQPEAFSHHLQTHVHIMKQWNNASKSARTRDAVDVRNRDLLGAQQEIVSV